MGGYMDTSLEEMFWMDSAEDLPPLYSQDLCPQWPISCLQSGRYGDHPIITRTLGPGQNKESVHGVLKEGSPGGSTRYPVCGLTTLCWNKPWCLYIERGLCAHRALGPRGQTEFTQGLSLSILGRTRVRRSSLKNQEYQISGSGPAA